MTTLGERIKLLRGELTQKQFSEQLGIPATTLGNYENNKSELNFATIDRFKTIFKVNTDWLLFGRGPMKEDSINNELRKKTIEIIGRRDDIIMRTPLL